MPFGSGIPRAFGNAPSVPTFPQSPRTYTSPDGAIVVPSGAIDKWFAYRKTLAATRGDVVVFGDSTTYGSGGLYSICQRLRDKASGASTGGPAGFGMADGGKGMFAGGEGVSGSPIAYDAPEINGFVSTTFNGFSDQFDNTDGQYYYDDGVVANHTLVLQFRQPTARLWYSKRANVGSFTYSIDGGTAVTVDAYQASGGQSNFVYISGLTPNTTHTLTVTNLATATRTACYVALAPMNTTGVVFQKYATSGNTFNIKFFGGVAASPYTQSQGGAVFQTPFGRAPTTVYSPTYRGAPVETANPAGGVINPVLGISHLGFNDLTNSASDTTALWTEYVKRFAGVCADGGVPGIVLSGQLPYNAQWPTYGAARFNAVKNQALAEGLVFVDLFYPIGGASLSYAGGTNNPHLTKAQYQTQADYLWDNLLGLA